MYFMQVHMSTRPFADHSTVHADELEADHGRRGLWLWPPRMADKAARLIGTQFVGSMLRKD